MTTPTQASPMVPVEVAFQGDNGEVRKQTVLGEPTPNPHLVIVPLLNNGRFTGTYSLTHAPSGLGLCRDEPHALRDVASKLAHLDWTSVTSSKDVPKPLAVEATKVIRECLLTDPTAVELPAHDAWGPDGRGKGLKRAAVPLATDFLADFHRSSKKLHGDDAIPLDVPDPDSPKGTKPNPEWMHHCSRQVQDFGLIYLLLALHRVDPEIADSAAAFLADQWDSGDSIGEWTWEWHQALLKGEELNLPGVPKLGELFTAVESVEESAR